MHTPAAHLEQLGRVELDDAGVDALGEGGDHGCPRGHIDARRESLGREDHLPRREREGGGGRVEKETGGRREADKEEDREAAKILR